MSDRELLELAAKAAGLPHQWCDAWNTMAKPRPDGGFFFEKVWNPLRDDGDALRLAVTLGLVIDCSRPSAGEPYKQHAIWRDELCDTATLTRRAIVRVAAEIGRSKT